MFAIKIIDQTSGAQDEIMARVRARVLFSYFFGKWFLALARDSSSPHHHWVMENAIDRFLEAIFFDVWIRAINGLVLGQIFLVDMLLLLLSYNFLL